MYHFKKTLAFLYIFLCTGFIMGTLTLSLIVESLVAYSRRTGWMVQHENLMVIVIIVIFILYSLLIAIWLTKNFFNYKSTGKIILLLLLTAATAYSLKYWLTPKAAMPDKYYPVSRDGRFVSGPYPDADKIQYLKKHGFTAIISLLNPYVVPFEPILMNKEVTLAHEYDIPVFNFSMLPWITKNIDSIAKIKALASEKNSNKYYVHCYYGRDRVSMFMRVVNKASPIPPNMQPALNKPKINSIATLPFELGTAYLVNKHIIFGPTPTEDEFALYIVNLDKEFTDTPIQTIIEMQEEKDDLSPYEQAIKKYGINFSEYISHDHPYDPIKLLEFARKLKAIPDGVIVYADYADPRPMPRMLEGTLYSYITDLPALPFTHMKNFSMANGKAEQIAVNIMIGPQPKQNEYAHQLYNVGIRAIAYIGDCDSPQSTQEKAKAENAKILFYCFASSDPQLMNALAQNGPWYVYGPELNRIEDTLESHFIKTIPKLDKKP